MLPQEILRVGSSEIAGNVYFSIHFSIFKVFKEGNQATRKGALYLSLWKVGVTCPLCPRYLRPWLSRNSKIRFKYNCYYDNVAQSLQEIT